MHTKEPILQLTDVRFSWSKRTSFTLNAPQFALESGETLLLLGESGSGKSTLLSLISGTASPQSGSIKLAGTELSALSGSVRDRLRAEKIGVIFQQFNLLPFGSVLDNILLPLRFAPMRRAKVKDPKGSAAQLCEALGLSKDTLPRKASTLSIGQQQRVAAARALIGSPPLIIADEPTSALDASNQGIFLDLVFEQVHRAKASFLMVSHDQRLAERFDRVVQIGDILKSKELTA